MTQENKDILLKLLDRHRELGISEQIDYDKFYLYSIIVHSTAIEGSTVTEVEAQLLFDEGITSSKRTMQEQMMNLDLKVKVPECLAAFCEELNRRRKAIDPTDISAVYDLSFWAHYELVTIHPWADGNGRTSRLLMNLLQWEFGVLPTKVLKEDKATYIQALIDTREKEDIVIFQNCMATLHARHLRDDINQYLSTTTGTTQKGRNTTQKKLSTTQKAILDYLKEHPTATRQEVAEALGNISEDGIKYHFSRLQKKGYLKREGGRKLGRWTVVID